MVCIDGYSIESQPKEIKKIIGVVPQEVALYNQLTAWENLIFWGSLYHINKNELHQRANQLLDLFGLYNRKDDTVASYSGGMKRRINIAAALLHQPKVLFMDEPTVGIDPQSRNLIFEVVKKLNQDGITVIYTTHYMEEAEKLCSRIGIIDSGRIIAQGTLDELRKQSDTKETVCITVTNYSEESIKSLMSEFDKTDLLDNKVYFYTDGASTQLSKIISQCRELNIDISNIEIRATNLESIFLKLTGKQLRD